ncbi:hypothetical protein DXG03_008729 [Asterophora parasitica]|uniref:Uncharacterized protein n=1 Tax=Asterophora parasitica TaxID=117018 RepID=A0A9P7KDY8_9AGAR|nr:hypothetical protein DXG03_008729 [Asterophora parasitica]
MSALTTALEGSTPGPTSTSSMSSTTTTGGYKGKVTHRSWQQLPEELVRHIATFFLWEMSGRGYVPHTWDTRESWHHRMLYTVLRDAHGLEHQFMSICPQWHLAVQQHLFWQQAISLIDPFDTLAHHVILHPKPHAHSASSAPAPPTRLSPHRHFRNITSCSCLVCRLNHPASSHGLASAKRYLSTPHLHTIAVCKDHDRRPASFCGSCLRAVPSFHFNPTNPAAPPQALPAAAQSQIEGMLGIMDNDDPEAFGASVEATCRSCRIEYLWKRAGERDVPFGREAIGGTKLEPEDWEARSVVESYIDLAEGNVRDVLLLAREKLWLRKNTRLGDMLLQALAASKFNAAGGSPALEYEDSEEEEDDIEIMQAEEAGARELALGDWARGRILDGHWVSPADMWYGHDKRDGAKGWVRAVHPCPWTRDASSFGSSPPPEEDVDSHPTRATLKGEIPPSFALCEQAFIAHSRQMKVVLGAAMRNLVRKIVVECQTRGKVEDPAIRAARMSIEEVLRALREEEGLWFDGFDWVERGRNARAESERIRGRQCDSSDGSTSTGSTGSSGTSPVLSTTTLQTTPSPPPTVPPDELKEASDDPVMISVAPVLNPPKLLRPIPYIPVTAAHFPSFTMDAVKGAWRDACAPLYHCRCSICLRAHALANAAKGPAPQPQPQTHDTPPNVVPTQDPQETAEADADGEDEIEVLEEEDIYETGDENETGDEDVLEEDYGYAELESASASEEEDQDRHSRTLRAHTPAPPRLTSILIPPSSARARKRSCDEIDGRVEGDCEEDEDEGTRALLSRSGTPPKRARTESSDQSSVTPDQLKFKPGDSLNPYDPAAVSLGQQGVFDRIDAGQSPLSDPKIMGMMKDPEKKGKMFAAIAEMMKADAEECRRTGEDPHARMMREKAEWAAKDLRASVLKPVGNASFVAGDYKRAFLVYSACTQLSPHEAVYHLNCAAAALKLRVYEEAYDSAMEALESGGTGGPGLAKAYFRRAQARKSLGLLAEAAEDLMEASRRQPGDVSVQKEMEEVKNLELLGPTELEEWVKGKKTTLEEIFGSVEAMENEITAIQKGTVEA